MFFALILALFAADDPANEPYAWPLDLPRQLTSSFAEYRSGRFHMGIDLRTGPIGKNVYAAGNGYVSRVRCSPYGYGKAVYLQLNDGNSVVYAHLDDYAPELGDYVRRAQHAARNYTVDLYPERGQFPVKRGALIAKSGQTGIGVPHLHYEFRDPSGAPINPRNLGIDWPDSTAPVIQKALLVPAAPEATVDHDYKPFVLSVRRDAAGNYTTDPVAVSGPVALGVDVIDPANEGASKLGIYQIDTTVAGEPVFTLRHDRVSYAHNGDGSVAYHPFFLHEGRFLMQWRWPGNQVESYQVSARDGAFTLEGPSADLVARIADVHGNTATLTIPLRNEAFTPPEVAATTDGGTGAFTVDCYGPWLVFSVQFEGPEGVEPVLVREGRDIERQPFARVGYRTFRAVYAPQPGVSRINAYVDHPRVDPELRTVYVQPAGGSRITASLSDGVEADIPGGSPYGALFLGATERPVSAPRGMRAYGDAVQLWPEDTPLRESVALRFDVPDAAANASNLAVYRRSGGGWSYQGGARRGKTLDLTVSRYGEYALMEDTTPPRIAIEPVNGVSSRRPAIIATISDNESGIANFDVTLNGEKWLLFEYDPERNVLEWEGDEDLPEGTQTIVVTVSDQAGNRAVAETDCTIAIQ